jgi:hypothetical protein
MIRTAGVGPANPYHETLQARISKCICNTDGIPGMWVLGFGFLASLHRPVGCFHLFDAPVSVSSTIASGLQECGL